MSFLRFTGYVLVLVAAGIFSASMLDFFSWSWGLLVTITRPTALLTTQLNVHTSNDTTSLRQWCWERSIQVGNTQCTVFNYTSAGNAESLGFIFLLPLTTLAWKRIGWDRVVIIVGSSNVWNSDPLLYTVLTSVRELDAIVVLLDAHPRNSVIVSQVRNVRLLSRICITFHSNL